MSEPIPNKAEQDVLNNLSVALQQYALLSAAFGVLERDHFRMMHSLI